MYRNEDMTLTEQGGDWYFGFKGNKSYKIANPEVITFKSGEVVEIVWERLSGGEYAKVHHIRIQPIIEMPTNLQGGEGSWLINRLDLEGRGRWYLAGVKEGCFCEITYPAKELLGFLSQLQELKTDE
mgnify:CR=1 FL=1